MKFFQTFRGRLLFILAILLVATLGVQFYLNYQTEEQNERIRERQAKALVTGVLLGYNSMSSQQLLSEFVKGEGQKFLTDDSVKRRIIGIFVITDKWQVWDSLDEAYAPGVDENGDPHFYNLSDLKDLPPLIDSDQYLGEDSKNFPNATVPDDSVDNEARAIPIKTTKGQWYIMVVLRTDKTKAAQRAARPLIYTLLLLLGSSILYMVLVWRFTRPVANLSNAARRIAEGDLCVRVPEYGRTDEMGQLASQFNEMTAELEKKRDLEIQLQQAEKSAVVGRLGSAIAHEIRNPLNYINLTLDHLRAKFAPEEIEKREDFEKLTSQLKSEVARINQQITDFLSYSRPAKVNLQPTDVRRVIEDSLRIIEGQADEQHIKLSVTEEENVPKIEGDAEFLRSVFNNLFINAIQAIEASGGKVNVKIAPDENFVKIEITDTGKGISEENLSNIFEPYFSTKETGTGLGLAIVQKVVEVHNGTIEVESKLNEGTKFIVRLPKS